MNRFDDFYEEDRRGDEMMTIASHCRRFSRRGDFDVFNMSSYMSCENCSHLNGENQCGKKLEERRNEPYNTGN